MPLKIREIQGSEEFEKLSTSEKLIKWMQDEKYKKEHKIGHTVIFYGNCITCNSLFESSATFHSHDQAFAHNPIYCPKCLKFN